MKLTINIKKRYLSGILASVLVIVGIFAVYAVWDTNKNFWHSGNDVKVTIGGVDYSLQEAIDTQKLLVSVSAEGSCTVNDVTSGGGHPPRTCEFSLGAISDWSICFLTGQDLDEGQAGYPNRVACNVIKKGSDWVVSGKLIVDTGTLTCKAVCIK